MFYENLSLIRKKVGENIVDVNFKLHQESSFYQLGSGKNSANVITTCTNCCEQYLTRALSMEIQG